MKGRKEERRDRREEAGKGRRDRRAEEGRAGKQKCVVMFLCLSK